LRSSGSETGVPPEAAVTQQLPAREAVPTVEASALDIVIVSWNTRDLVARCLDSIQQHGPTNLVPEVFVVDNASADGTANMVRDCFPQVRLIENRANMGFASANNQALRRGTARYALMLNPDTEVQTGTLQTLVSFMDSNLQAGAAGARLLYPDGTLQAWCSPVPTLARELWRLFHLDTVHRYAQYDMARWDDRTPRDVEMVPGTCLIVRREALHQVGLLDEDFFIYSEEVDLCERLRRHGWHVYWVPQAVVVHHAGQSTHQVAASMFLQLYRSKVVYFRKHHGRLGASIYKVIVAAAALVRLCLGTLTWLDRSPRGQRRQLLARHYRRLLSALPSM
jgi:GT2 family glycosyltransferase